MELVTPSYYYQFHCIAGQCPDSCCKDWGVLVDPESAAFYRSLPGPLGECLRQTLEDTQDGVLLFQEHHCCPLWRTDGLCRLQAELGEDALCQVCAEYPRLTHDYGSFSERGLELSCPEAARLILNDVEARLCTQSVPGGEAPEYDQEAMNLLVKTRQIAFSFLKNPAYSVPEALTLLLFYGYHTQQALDEGEDVLFDPQKALSASGQIARPGSFAEILDILKNLEILTDDWRKLLDHPGAPLSWSEHFRALARYGVLRYWLQAVSDYDLVCRVKWIVMSCIIIRNLGGDVYRTAQLYSKEIENDIDNLDALLDAAYSNPAFTDAHLLYWLHDRP